MFPISIADCLVKSSAKVPLLVLEDVYVTGLLPKYCQITLKNSEHFQYMGIDDYNSVLVHQMHDIVIHRVNMEKMNEIFTQYWIQNGMI